jgi:hypothetical protein
MFGGTDYAANLAEQILSPEGGGWRKKKRDHENKADLLISERSIKIFSDPLRINRAWFLISTRRLRLWAFDFRTTGLLTAPLIHHSPNYWFCFSRPRSFKCEGFPLVNKHAVPLPRFIDHAFANQANLYTTGEWRPKKKNKRRSEETLKCAFFLRAHSLFFILSCLVPTLPRRKPRLHHDSEWTSEV